LPRIFSRVSDTIAAAMVLRYGHCSQCYILTLEFWSRTKHDYRFIALEHICADQGWNLQKLEETVAENARLEHELLMLRQKVQASRRMDRSASPAAMQGSGSSVALEMELRRVQSLVGDLQRQRYDLSNQVR